MVWGAFLGGKRGDFTLLRADKGCGVQWRLNHMAHNLFQYTIDSAMKCCLQSIGRWSYYKKSYQIPRKGIKCNSIFDI